MRKIGRYQQFVKLCLRKLSMKQMKNRKATNVTMGSPPQSTLSNIFSKKKHNEFTIWIVRTVLESSERQCSALIISYTAHLYLQSEKIFDDMLAVFFFAKHPHHRTSRMLQKMIINWNSAHKLLCRNYWLC